MPWFSPQLGLLVVLLLALLVAWHPKSRTYGFASWVVAAVLAGLIYPNLYLYYLPTDYSQFLNYLLQIAMFGYRGRSGQRVGSPNIPEGNRANYVG